MCRAALPAMRLQGQGLIINVASIAGRMGLPFRGIYSASKAAVEILTETLNIELKPFGIRACSILPGDVRTNINAARLVAMPPASSPYRSSVETMNTIVNDEVSKAEDPIYIAKIDQHQARRRFHAHDAGRFGANEAMLNGDGDGADGAVAAHGQAAAGFDKQHRYVVFGVVGRVQNTARHHVVAARFKHQTFANPVVFAEKMLAFFAHVAAFKNGATARYDAYGIAAGVGINAEKSFGRHGIQKVE